VMDFVMRISRDGSRDRYIELVFIGFILNTFIFK